MREISAEQQAQQRADIDTALQQCGTELEYTPFLSLESIIYLVEQLNSAKGSHVRSLKFVSGNLEGEIYAKEIAKLQHVAALDLSRNGVSTAGAIALLKNSNFRSLNLSNNDFDETPSGQAQLRDAVLTNHTVVKLNIERSCPVNSFLAEVVEAINTHVANNAKKAAAHANLQLADNRQTLCASLHSNGKLPGSNGAPADVLLVPGVKA